MFSVYKPEKWCFCAELLETAPGLEEPSCALSESFIARSVGPCRGARLLAGFLLTSYHLEEHGPAAWLVTRGSSYDLEAFFISIFQVRNLIRGPLASNPGLVPSQSPSGAPVAGAWHGCGSALLLQALWVLGKSLNSGTTRSIICWQSGP